MNSNEGCDKMTKILITGGSGFIGRSVVRGLIEKGFEVNLLDLFNPNISNVNYFNGSVLNQDDIAKAMQGCDYVIHLAAVLGVSKASYHPVECLDVNIKGIINILNCCVQNKVKKIIFSSSSEVYGEPNKIPISEDAALQPRSEYGVSKLVGEEYIKAYNKQHNLDYTILRFFNVYGIEQRHSWVMARFTNYAALGQPLLIYGKGDQVRAFCHIKDAVRGIAEALLSDNTNNQTFNIGNNKEPVSMRELALRILKIAGGDENIKFLSMNQTDRTVSREIYKRVPCTEKAKNTFGFEARISLDEGIKEIIEHKKSNLSEVKNQVDTIERLETELLGNKIN